MDTDSLYKTALGMCQMLLRSRVTGGSAFLEADQIRSAVEEVSEMPSFAAIDKMRLVRELEERFTVYAPPHRTLGEDDDHVAWLSGKRAQISWRYWDRYLIYLQDRLPERSIASLERAIDDVLGRLEDPRRHGEWDRRGLVMGHVQSGKTANYCGLICKAADADYKVIIVLSGVHNSLRSQTQLRLDEGFLGFKSEPVTAGGMQTFRPIGVGEIDRSLRANTVTNWMQNGDFNTRVANHFGIQPGGLPLLFVVKKNATILNNLLRWIRSCADTEDKPAGRRFVRNVPALIIDDEADLASIDTRQQQFDENKLPDPEHDPSRINGLIRQILRSFEKVAYVGYTATPFANIFIHDRGFTRELGDDLFPRSFIVRMEPPSNYLGPKETFGIRAGNDAGLEQVEPLPLLRFVIDHAESERSDEVNGWMPPKLVRRTEHRPEYAGRNDIPPSLRDAMMSFILSVATRRIRKQGTLHNSMLVHVVRYTAVQERVSEQVQIALKQIRQRLQNGDGDRTPTIQDEFRSLWEHDFVPTNVKIRQLIHENPPAELPDWKAVWQSLHSVAASIQVKTINGSARDVLDYEENRSAGMNVIAVGGDKLSRGLTLEGLSISYFLRSSHMYDTLMQMGRWFGYRTGYQDLCRLYTTAELTEWFAHIAAASEELQQEFDYMVEVGGTPRDYGLKVRSHPVLLVTSAVKMRNGTELELSFSGDISETIIFDSEQTWVQRNYQAVENWLHGRGKPKRGSRAGGYDWHELTAQEIIDLLSVYSTHEDNVRANTDLFIRYIKEQLAHGELQSWSVRLCSSGESDARLTRVADLEIGQIKRKPFPPYQQKGRYSIRQLVSPGDELFCHTEAQKKTALQNTIRNWEAKPNRLPDEEPPSSPGRREARQVRPDTHGLLLLYPLDPIHAGIVGLSTPIMGLAVSFPESPTARKITYRVNNVFTQRGDDEPDF